MLKIFKIAIIFLFISNCGYVPIYYNQNNLGLNINVVSLEGEKDINISIAQKLNRYQSEKNEKVYDVKVVSDYEKKTLTKNETGNITNFRLILDVDFIVNVKNEYKTMNFVEKFDMKENDTLFEQSNYEKNIKKDMIDLIIQKFTSQLLTFQ